MNQQYYKKHFECIKKVLNNLQLKKKPKSDIVELANSLGIHTIGTKDSLIQNMALKITSLVLEDGNQSSEKQTPEDYLQSPKFKAMSQDLRAFFQVLLKYYKKQLKKLETKEKQTTKTIISTDPVPNLNQLPNPNKSISFNPTFQNYNFIHPYFQSSMNFGGYNNPGLHNNHLLNTQRIPNLLTPGLNSLGQLSNSIPPLNIDVNKTSTNINSNLHQNPMITPHSTPLHQTSGIQNQYDALLMNYNNSLNNQIPSYDNKFANLSNLINPINPMNSINSLNQLNPNMGYQMFDPRLLFNYQMNQYNNYNNNPYLKSTSTPVNSNIQTTKPSQEIIINQNISCICQKKLVIVSPEIECAGCKKKFHESCIKIIQTTEKAKKQFECPYCTIKKIDPLHQVITVLKEDIINFENLREKVTSVSIRMDKYHDLIKDDNVIQIRCIKLDGISNYEISWPDQAILRLNDEKTIEFKPLQYHSSVKKRKDDSIIIESNTLRKCIFLTIKLEIKPATKENLKLYRIKEDYLYAFGIYIVKKLPIDKLVSKICTEQTKNVNQCKNFIKKHISDSDQGDIQIQKLAISLQCSYNLEKINTPARGKYCTHIQCFSLQTFILMMNTTLFRNWKCPICKKRCFDMYVDAYLQQIIKESNEMKQKNIKEIAFDKNGNYTFSISDKVNQEEQLQSKQKQSRSQQKLIDDIQDQKNQDKKSNTPIQMAKKK